MLAIFYLIAIVLGIVNGIWGSSATQSFADFIATMFIRLFKFVAIPIIAVSIISTLSSISKSRSSGRIFRHTIFSTLFTTILAATLAALLYEVFSPENVSASISGAAAAPLSSVANAGGAGYLKYIESVIPDNILAPFLSANVLSVLLISAAVGIALAQMKPSKAQETLVSLFAGLQEVLFRIVSWIIKVLPIGIFGFFSVLAADLASGVELGGLGVYFAAVLTANFVQMLVILPIVLLARGLNPLKVAKAMLPALTVAFFSKSSAGTLPVTMASAENRLGVRRPVSRFVLPICTTINMNGCAAFILLTVVYLMQNAGADITLGTLIVWILISTLAAVGNAGVPMGCFFLSASLLAGMNVPILLMGVILPFYAVVDAIETALNVWSDSCVAAMVDHDLKDETFDA
ncbi:dicarboxylate/amino acid:cation symporter [Sutterella wadsworthensis]|uniref:dicarboxylate/amino acid:cation symporter n=1 Tax=Sutterella wadsworthensis TaxID=40545 RepID=UPI00396725D3